MERARNKWVINGYNCSYCGFHANRMLKFCPNCGCQGTKEELKPVVAMYWLLVDDEEPTAYDCSNCGAMVTKKYNYCPCCGGCNKGVEKV